MSKLTRGEVIAMVLFDLGYKDADDDTKSRIGILVDSAEKYIKESGITLDLSKGVEVNDGQLIAMYADYLYERRKLHDNPMPRMLRWQLNNRLLSEKMNQQQENGE